MLFGKDVSLCQCHMFGRNPPREIHNYLDKWKGLHNWTVILQTCS